MVLHLCVGLFLLILHFLLLNLTEGNIIVKSDKSNGTNNFIFDNKQCLWFYKGTIDNSKINKFIKKKKKKYQNKN